MSIVYPCILQICDYFIKDMSEGTILWGWNRISNNSHCVTSFTTPTPFVFTMLFLCDHLASSLPSFLCSFFSQRSFFIIVSFLWPTSTNHPTISVSLMMMMATAMVARKMRAVERKKKMSLKKAVLRRGWTLRLRRSECQEAPFPSQETTTKSSDFTFDILTHLQHHILNLKFPVWNSHESKTLKNSDWIHNITAMIRPCHFCWTDPKLFQPRAFRVRLTWILILVMGFAT